jgi:hypothetical protein
MIDNNGANVVTIFYCAKEYIKKINKYVNFAGFEK